MGVQWFSGETGCFAVARSKSGLDGHSSDGYCRYYGDGAKDCLLKALENEMLNLDYYFESRAFPGVNFLVLSEVTDLLARGKKVNLRTLAHDGVKTSFKFRKPKVAHSRPGFWVHGDPARHIEQVLSYLSGDAHDRSKVQWFDGAKFHDLLKDPNSF